jgi:phage shock protein PspC (stress-responsive transcriptional regulator)
MVFSTFQMITGIVTYMIIFIQMTPEKDEV